jgi:L-fuconolactonase
MTIIDSHAHIWRRERTPQPWVDSGTMSTIDRDFWVTDLAAAQRAAGIDGAVVVQSAPSTQETADLLEAADGTIIRGVIGWVDLDGDGDAQLERLCSGPGGEHLVGLRHPAHQDRDPRWLERPRELPHDLVFDLVITADQLASATRCVDTHPDVPFVLDHLGNPPVGRDLSRWRDDITDIARRPNVVAKVSGLAMQADWTAWRAEDLRPILDVALDSFGPSRMLFGSDWPVVELTGGLNRWMPALSDLLGELSPSERDAVYRRSALRTYLGFDDA